MNLCLWVFTVCKVRTDSYTVTEMEKKGKRDMERACDPYSSKCINENECAAKWLNFVWVVHEWQCVFFAIALFALCWWSVVLSHSLSLFADFLSFTPRTFTDGLLHSLFDHLLFLVLCFLLNSYSFFLSPFHTYTNEHIQKKNDVDGDDP